METVCQLSYPLNSENASPSGTRTVYLARPVCCAEVAPPPKTASTERASETTTIATAGTLLLFIASPRCRTGCQHRSYGPAESGTHGWKGQILRYCDRQAPALFFHFGDPLQAALGWSVSTRAGRGSGSDGAGRARRATCRHACATLYRRDRYDLVAANALLTSLRKRSLGKVSRNIA